MLQKMFKNERNKNFFLFVSPGKRKRDIGTTFPTSSSAAALAA